MGLDQRELIACDLAPRSQFETCYAQGWQGSKRASCLGRELGRDPGWSEYLDAVFGGQGREPV